MLHLEIQQLHSDARIFFRIVPNQSNLARFGQRSINRYLNLFTEPFLSEPLERRLEWWTARVLIQDGSVDYPCCSTGQFERQDS